MRLGWHDATRIHALAALIPALAFLLLHALQVATAAPDRGGFVEGVWGMNGNPLLTVLETVGLVVPLGVHVGLGVALGLRRQLPPGIRPLEGFRTRLELRWQRATGLVAALFLVAHLAQAWTPRLLGLPGGAVFDRLSVELGQPGWLAVHAVGLTAVAVHVAVGIPAATARLGWVRTDSGRRAARVLGPAVAVVLWALSVRGAARFVTGGVF